jgi:hypothetical protein
MTVVHFFGTDGFLAANTRKLADSGNIMKNVRPPARAFPTWDHLNQTRDQLTEGRSGVSRYIIKLNII